MEEQSRDRGSGRVIDGVPEAAIRAQLARVVSCPIFERAARMQRFLAFLVEERLAGREDQLKEYTIAVSVFDKPTDFDPGTSAVIRVEAGRLRRMLEQYALRFGDEDGIAFDIPKGTYIPVFNRSAPAANAVSDGPAAAEREAAWPTADERRLITVISCAFGDECRGADYPLDREFLNAFDAFHDVSSKVAARHGGSVESGASDRILVHFGWPEALEDAGGRALTAALEMVEAAAAVLGKEGHGLRVGVATSEVAIRAVSVETEGKPCVIGPAPVLASVISPHAPLNGVLVADSTRRLAGNAFDFVPAGALAGDDRDHAPLWRLIGRRAPTTRFHAQRGTDANEIIGRREEIALLLGKWRLTLEGESQIIAIVGEAGIGKSILAEAAVSRMEQAEVLRLQCSPHHMNSSLYPFIDLLRQLLPLDEDSDYEELAGQFLAPLGIDGSQERGLLAALLSRVESNDQEALPASRQKDLTLRLLAKWIAGRAQSEPALLLVEDLHWADATTVELLQQISRSAASTRLMLLVTSRNDVDQAFSQQTNLTSLRLARLPKSDCDVLISSFASTAEVPAAARDAILSRAEGIPLFIEELTRLCLGSGAWRSDGQVPTTLRDLLGSQLSRLGSARGIAQIAAVMGRRFSRDMLMQAVGRGPGEVDSALDRLQAAGVIVRSSTDEEDFYQFRHALLRDAAYESILDQPRRELHGKVASILIEAFPDMAGRHPELVADHLMEAMDYAEAFPFWVDAGENAARRYALVEAASAYRKALEALGHLPANPANAERELEVLIALGQVIRSAQGYGDEELLAIYGRARTLAAELGDGRQLANAVYGLWTHAAGRGRWPDAVTIAGEFEDLTRDSDSTQLHVEAQRLLGASAAFRGDFESARLHFSRAMEIYDIDRHGPDYGFDPGAASAAYLAWVLWHLGDDASARDYGARALAIADAKAHAPTLAMVLSWLMFHAVCRRDLEAIAAYNRRLQSVCAERECRYWQPFGSACAEWAGFEVDGDVAHLERLVAFTKAFRERYFTSSLLLLAADICLQKDRPDQGIQLTKDAQQFMKDHDERLWEAEAQRLTAEFLFRLSPGDPGDAQRHLVRAVKTARRQGALKLEQRAAASLANLHAGPAALHKTDSSDGRPHVLH